MYRIVTDTSANLPWSYIKANGLTVIPFSYTLDGVEHSEHGAGDFDGQAYYAAIRNGAKAATSQIPPQRYIDALTPLLEGGEDVLFVGMSSGISGAYQSAEMAAAELREQFPARAIRTVDTLAASLGEGLQVMRAVELRNSGLSLDAAADALLTQRKNVCQLLLVDDLFYLRRTGRVSGVTAVVGSLLGVKPLLKGNAQGQLVISAKARGRKQAIRMMAQRWARLAADPGSQVIGIAHAGCPADAATLAALIDQAAKPRELLTVCYEPVTGAHTGPDALALFFRGADDVREQD